MPNRKLFFLVLFFANLQIGGQERTVRSFSVEYGLRVVRSSNIFTKAVPFLEEDFGLHFLDGFFVRFRQSEFAFRLGLGYFTNGFMFPYYERTPKALKYTKTSFLQYFGGMQYRPGRQKLFYALADFVYSTIKKEGYILGTNGPLLLLNTFRHSYGVDPGLGVEYKVGNYIWLILEFHQNVCWQRSLVTETLPYGGALFYEEDKRGIKTSSSVQFFITLQL